MQGPSKKRSPAPKSTRSATAESSSHHPRHRHRQAVPSWFPWAVVGAVIVVMAVVAFLFIRERRSQSQPKPAQVVAHPESGKESKKEAEKAAPVTPAAPATSGRRPPVITKIAEQSAERGKPLSFKVEAKDPNLLTNPLKFRLSKTSAKAKIDPDTGQFTWDLADAKTNATYAFTVEVSAGPSKAEQSFEVKVAAVNDPGSVERLAADLAAKGPKVEVLNAGLAKSPFSAPSKMLRVDGEMVAVFQYDKPEAAEAALKATSDESLSMFGTDLVGRSQARVFRRDRLVVLFPKDQGKVIEHLTAVLGEAYEPAMDQSPPPAAKKAPATDKDSPAAEKPPPSKSKKKKSK